MKAPFILITTVLCMALSPAVRAQDSTNARHAFFNNPHPALLFSVSSLTLSKFDGGIGVALKGNQNYFWRFSVDFSENGYVDRSAYRNTQRDYHFEEWYISAAPLFVLSESSPGFVFLSPYLQFSYSQGRSTSSYTDSLATYVSSSYGKSWLGVGGLGVGFGFPLTERILLTGEYRYSVNVSFAPAGASKYSLSHKTWDTGSQVLFALCCKL